MAEQLKGLLLREWASENDGEIIRDVTEKRLEMV